MYVRAACAVPGALVFKTKTFQNLNAERPFFPPFGLSAK
jgi:hypothetical protein